MKPNKIQMTLSPAQRFTPSAQAKHAAEKGESHELQGLNGTKPKIAITSGQETLVDDMVYRKTARCIAAVDISYSSLMVALQLLGLIIGATHSAYTKNADEQTSTTSLTYGQRSPPPTESPALSPKIRETLAVLVWTGLFSVCIIQLVVAGALYGGTNERDGRKCIRNCRMWCLTTMFLIGILVCQILGIFIVLYPQEHIWLLFILLTELSFRLTGLIYIKKFIKELAEEFSDDDNMDRSEQIQYEQLIPLPIPILKNPHYDYIHDPI